SSSFTTSRTRTFSGWVRWADSPVSTLMATPVTPWAATQRMYFRRAGSSISAVAVMGKTVAGISPLKFSFTSILLITISRVRTNALSPTGSRIEPVAQAVPQKVESEHHAKDRQAGHPGDPPLRDQEPTCRHHRSPLRRRWDSAEAEEGEGREGDDRVANVQGEQGDEGPSGIRKDVPCQGADRPVAQYVGGLHVLLVALNQDEAAAQP